jgi:hypothetical protein
VAKSAAWKKGRGKLGVLEPLLGTWHAKADTPMGPVACTRSFARTLNGSYIQLVARWEFAKGAYEEVAIIGAPGGEVGFWSFTSDGKRSEGRLADVTDIHPQAVGFEAKMPAGLARMAYWPDGEGGFHWAVESKNAKGWKRFTEHHYRPAAGADEATSD